MSLSLRWSLEEDGIISSGLQIPALSVLLPDRSAESIKARRRHLKILAGNPDYQAIGRPPVQMAGKRFGRLEVIRRVESKKFDRPAWECKCDCGSIVILPGGRLRGGANKSCGCLRRDRAGNLYRTHGLSKTDQYTMFYDARKRALALSLPFDIKPEDIVIPEYCPIFKSRLCGHGGERNDRPSIDRVVPSLGYVRNNIRVISFRANRIKSDSTPSDLRLIIDYCEGRL